MAPPDPNSPAGHSSPALRRRVAKYKDYLEDNMLPLPTPAQCRWLDAEVGMFVHFGLNTYADLEWSDGTLAPALFNPGHLDCSQWIAVARSFGARYAVLTAKHHDGFCLWPTETTDYSVKHAPYKDGTGDVVGEFLAACEAGGVWPGLYLSPWDRHEPCYPEAAAYDAFYVRQLTELLTWYNVALFEIWFDGAGSKGREYDWARIIATCREHQPDAMIFNMGAPTIRWAGNEAGLAPDPNWNVLQVGADFRAQPKRELDGVGVVLESCDGLGNAWVPAECDTTIRYGHWFWHTDDAYLLRPVTGDEEGEGDLMEVYEKSVGRGANLLLNVAPNREGLIPIEDARVARAFGQEIQRRYGTPLASTTGEGTEVRLEVRAPVTFDRVMIQEDVTRGQRVRAYVVERREGHDWQLVSRGRSVGHKKIDRLAEPVTAARLRLRVLEALRPPVIRHFGVYSTRGRA